ncbi:MAG: hypothetical protein ACWGN7_08155 [Thermodesulfovibrionales bacterium]
MRKDIWIFLFFLGVVMFSWPVISIFWQRLSLYFFVAWGVFIALIFLAARSADREDSGG